MSSINSANLDFRQHTEFEIHQIYCGLDNALTHESLSAEYELFDSNANPRPYSKHIYNFERALQAPYMDIMLRGFAVDVEARWRACEDLKSRIDRMNTNLQQMAQAVWDQPIIPRSNKN